MDTEFTALNVIFTEFYYWVTVVMMFLIHVGFCTYEVGVSRRKNHMTTLMKNAMVIPCRHHRLLSVRLVVLFGDGRTAPASPAASSPRPSPTPWSELMARAYGRRAGERDLTAADTALWARLNGVFWAAFLLFSWTTASIVSGSIIERVKSGAFWLIAVMLGSVTWIIDAAWGWHPAGWMVQGARLSRRLRVGRRACDRRRHLPRGPDQPRSAHRQVRAGRHAAQHPAAEPLAGLHRAVPDLYRLLGLLRRLQHPDLRRAGRRRRVLLGDQHLPAADHALRHHLQLHHGAGGRPDGGLHRLEGRPVLDLLRRPRRRHRAPRPATTSIIRSRRCIIAAVIVVIIYKLHYWVERRFKIDDAVGAVAVHGYAGFLGVVVAGFVLWGYPSSPDALLGHETPYATVTPWGQFVGAVIMFFVLGFIPGYVLSWILKQVGLLRIPREVELAGLDHVIHATAVREDDEMRAVLAQEARRPAPGRPARRAYPARRPNNRERRDRT